MPAAAAVRRVRDTLLVTLAWYGLGNVPAHARTREVDWVFATRFIIGLVVFGLLYIGPSIIAFRRRHPNRWLIFVINIAFGDTGIGRLGTLLWALSAAHLSPAGNNGGESGLNLFVNVPLSVVIRPYDV